MLEVTPTDMEIPGRGSERSVSQQDLNGPWIDTGVEQMSGKGVAQGMNATALIDARLASGTVVNILGGATGHVALGVLAWEQPGPIAINAPISTQFMEQTVREQTIAILAAIVQVSCFQ